jgi:hypothetical protein
VLAITIKGITIKSEVTASILPTQELAMLAKYEPVSIEHSTSTQSSNDVSSSQSKGYDIKQVESKSVERECGGGVGDVSIGVPSTSAEKQEGVPPTYAEFSENKEADGVPTDK